MCKKSKILIGLDCCMSTTPESQNSEIKILHIQSKNTKKERKKKEKKKRQVVTTFLCHSFPCSTKRRVSQHVDYADLLLLTFQHSFPFLFRVKRRHTRGPLLIGQAAEHRTQNGSVGGGSLCGFHGEVAILSLARFIDNN